MPDFDDLFNPAETISNLRIELEEMTNKFNELETTYLYTQNERVQMVFAIREMKIHRDEYLAALEKEAWELIEKEAEETVLRFSVRDSGIGLTGEQIHAKNALFYDLLIGGTSTAAATRSRARASRSTKPAVTP